MENTSTFSRRDFIKTVSTAGAGLVLGFHLTTQRKNEVFAAEVESFSPNAWLRLDADDSITIAVFRSEMGQGVRTSIPMIIAEELEADWSKVRYLQPDFDPKYGRMGTGGSASIRTNMEKLRKAGAIAREMLITAAAQTWAVDRVTCRAENGAVIQASTGKKLSYGQLAAAAAQLPVPEDAPLKDPANFKIMGMRLPRLDTPEKVDGSAKYGIDVIVPGMLYAVVARCPVFGGKVAQLDATKAKLMSGVKDVFEIENGIAVVADSTWHAIKGREALAITWDEGPHAGLNSAGIRQMLIEKAKSEGALAQKEGEADTTFAAATKKLDAVYDVPFAAHTPMEPMNCLAHFKDGRCEIWAPTQSPQNVPRDVAPALGITEQDVTVHITLMGGAFGRRLESDFAVEAARLSKAINAPVKVTWTREDDMQHDWYRPVSHHVLSGAVDQAGQLTAWRHRVVAPSISAQANPDRLKNGLDRGAVECAMEMPYHIPNLYVDYVWAPVAVPVGWWRSVYASQNVFAVESFIDELASLAKIDPYQFRLHMLEKSPRMKNVVELAATKADWGKPLRKGHGLGLACAVSFRSYVAEVAEVSIDKDAGVRVHRVVAAVDCGMQVNPDTIEAQIEGSIVYGLSAALKGAITIEKGRVVQKDFWDYQMPRIDEMPKVEVYLVQSNEAPGGIGEPGLPPIAPAVANALFAITGKRIRRLPISAEDFKES
ncbi:MAG: molybdopterin cofactor-binding domain-containing protein [bacterium]